MGVPDPRLLRLYNTGEVYMKKGASMPLAATIATALISYPLMRAVSADFDRQALEARRMNDQIRTLQIMNNAGDVRNLRGGSYSTSPYEDPRMLNPGTFQNFSPSALEKGAAKIARQVGRGMAKESGIMSTIAGGVSKALPAIGAGAKKVVSNIPLIGRKAGWKTQAGLVGAAGLGAYGLYKGLGTANTYMGAPAMPQNLTARAAPARYVNEWGIPTM